MIDIRIPGFGQVVLEHLVLDFNGTLACDGILAEGVRELLGRLSRDLEIHVVTADTHGSAAAACEGLPCRLVVLPEGNQDVAKRDYVRELGAARTVCIGNGRNDRLMVREAAVGLCVIGGEGASAETASAAPVVCGDIRTALELLLHPKRLVATLRS
ncbi:MAG: ATPase P [Syntrophaceae bacterium]|nr:ATPase P [Syntrophaceae bacterium]